MRLNARFASIARIDFDVDRFGTELVQHRRLACASLRMPLHRRAATCQQDHRIVFGRRLGHGPWHLEQQFRFAVGVVVTAIFEQATLSQVACW
jgi:hypothetical protein